MSGTTTNARAYDLRMRQRQPLRAVLEVAEQQQVDVQRPRTVTHAGLPRGRAPARPPCTTSSSASGSSAVSIRTHALKKDRWSSTSPTGSVS